MNPPATPEPQVAKPSRRKRGCLITLIILGLLVPGYYWLEKYTGRRAVEMVVAEYAEAGFPLEAAAVLPATVPAEDNFGATPLLDGIMHPDDYSPGAKVAQGVMKSLTNLPSYQRCAYGWPLFTDKEWASLSGLDPAWPLLRTLLSRRKVPDSSAHEPSDVRAVFGALETCRALFDELSAAAQRPHAIFTPVPRERLSLWREQELPYPTNEIAALAHMAVLRARAAAVLGHVDEAMSLTAVLWQLRRAWLAESTLRAHFQAMKMQHFWQRSVQTILRCKNGRDAHLLQLLTTPGTEWSPEKEILHTLHGEATWATTAFQKVRAELFSDPRWGFSRLEENMLRCGPAGWVDENLTTGLRRNLNFAILPLQKQGFAGLPSAGQVLDELRGGDSERWSPNSFLLGSAYQNVLPPLCASSGILWAMTYSTETTRLMLLAIAAERYRLRHGRYPAAASALVPDCIAAIPPDIDSAPLRVVTSADGAKTVLYSIGWNLTDDWHGVIPATYKEDADWQNADWPVSLPFPPLPPP